MTAGTETIRKADIEAIHRAIFHAPGDVHSAALAALGRVEERAQKMNEEANALTRRAEIAEREARLLRLAMERIRDEPPDRGVAPNFREFAADCLAALSPAALGGSVAAGSGEE